MEFRFVLHRSSRSFLLRYWDLPEDDMRRVYRSARKAVEGLLSSLNEQVSDDDYYMGLSDADLLADATPEELEELEALANSEPFLT